MADILIRGAKMPTSCYSCEIGPSDQVWESCPFYSLTGKEQKAFKSKRHKKCPLLELPEHGDLIDAGKLIKLAYKRMEKWKCAASIDVLDIALEPVIIPSNKEV